MNTLGLDFLAASTSPNPNREIIIITDDPIIRVAMKQGIWFLLFQTGKKQGNLL